MHAQDQNTELKSAGAVSFEDFKRALGPAATRYSDEQIEELRQTFDKIADIRFDSWLKERNPDTVKTAAEVGDQS